MEKEILIRAQNLCKTYSTGSEHFHAIKNMNVDIYKGISPLLWGIRVLVNQRFFIF